jgi:hypothetical protein
MLGEPLGVAPIAGAPTVAAPPRPPSSIAERKARIEFERRMSRATRP